MVMKRLVMGGMMALLLGATPVPPLAGEPLRLGDKALDHVTAAGPREQRVATLRSLLLAALPALPDQADPFEDDIFDLLPPLPSPPSTLVADRLLTLLFPPTR